MKIDNAPETGLPLRVGALAPLSRPGFLEAGRHLAAGIELAVAEVNAAGGVAGRPLELLLRDTAGSGDVAVAAVAEFAAAGAVAMLGEYHSVVAHDAAGAAVAAGLPYLCSSAVLDAVVDAPTELVARIAPAQSHCWQVYSDYLVAAGRRHVVLLVEANIYWTSGARLLHGYLAERGVKVTELDHARFADASAVADAVAAAGETAGQADAVLLLLGYPEPAVSVVKALRADPRLPGLLIGDPAGRAECVDWVDRLGADGAEVPFLRYLPAEPTALGARVLAQLAEQLGETPSFVALEGYDSVQVLAEALRVAGADGLSLTEALREVSVPGTRGTVTFTADAGPVLQWAWPPVQIAVRPDAERPGEFAVRHQDGN